MKNLKEMECITLTHLECEQIEGGTDAPKGNMWYNIGYAAGEFIKSLW